MSIEREIGELKTMISVMHSDVKDIKNGAAPVCMNNIRRIEKLEGRPERGLGMLSTILSILSAGFTALFWAWKKGP